MPINFSCPGCQKPYTVPDQFAGKTTKCRQCGGALQIPQAEAAAPLMAEPAMYSAAAAPVAAAPTFAAVDPATPAAGFPVKKLVIIGSVAAVGLLLLVGMAVAGWYLLFSGPDPYKFLPNDCVAIASLRVEDFLASDTWKEIDKEFPDAKKILDGMEGDLGVSRDHLVRVIIATPYTDPKAKWDERPGAIQIALTSKAVNADDIKARQIEKASKFRKLSEFQETKVGDYTIYEANSIKIEYDREQGKSVEQKTYNGRGKSFCIVASKMVVYGQAKDLKAVLERDKKPELSDGLQAALKDTSMSKTFAFAAARKPGTEDVKVGMELFPGMNQLGKSMERFSGWISVDSKIQVALTMVCKDDKSAEDLRKMADLGLVAAKTQQQMPLPKEITDLIDAIKLNNKGNQVTGDLEVKSSDAIKAGKTLETLFKSSSPPKRTFDQVGTTIK